MANPDKYTTGKRKGMLKLPAIRKLVREHAKASKINIDKLTYDQTINKLKNNGFILNHEKMRITTSTRLNKPSKKQLLLMDKPPSTRAELIASKPKGRKKIEQKGDVRVNVARLQREADRKEKRKQFLLKVGLGSEQPVMKSRAYDEI